MHWHWLEHDGASELGLNMCRGIHSVGVYECEGMLSVLLNAPALTEGLPVGGRAVALGVSGMGRWGTQGGGEGDKQEPEAITDTLNFH